MRKDEASVVLDGTRCVILSKYEFDVPEKKHYTNVVPRAVRVSSVEEILERQSLHLARSMYLILRLPALSDGIRVMGIILPQAGPMNCFRRLTCKGAQSGLHDNAKLS